MLVADLQQQGAARANPSRVDETTIQREAVGSAIERQSRLEIADVRLHFADVTGRDVWKVRHQEIGSRNRGG